MPKKIKLTRSEHDPYMPSDLFVWQITDKHGSQFQMIALCEQHVKNLLSLYSRGIASCNSSSKPFTANILEEPYKIVKIEPYLYNKGKEQNGYMPCGRLGSGIPDFYYWD